MNRARMIAAVTRSGTNPDVTDDEKLTRSGTNPDVTDDEKLFRDAIRDTVPLKPVTPRVRRITPAAQVARRPQPIEDAFVESSSLSRIAERPLEPGEALRYLSDGLGPDVLRNLRRGAWPVRAQLDLHGMTRAQARVQVAPFLTSSRERGARCVCIIHGKGRGSAANSPVLKAGVKSWLAASAEVLAFCEAPARQGGGGATLVLLRRQGRSD